MPALSFLLLISSIAALSRYNPCTSIRRIPVWSILAFLSLGLAHAVGIVSDLGILLLVVMATLAMLVPKVGPGWPRALLILQLVLMALAIFSHQLPWFHAPLIGDELVWKADSVPYDFYLNYHKGAAGLCLLVALAGWRQQVPEQEQLRNQRHLLLIIIPVFAGFLLALSADLIQLEVGINANLYGYLALWMIANLMFTCVAEEVLFRGIVQRGLMLIGGHRFNPWFIVVGVSLLFGAAHFSGGLVFILVAALMGFAYGAVYYLSGRLLYAILLHFGVNLTHMMFFTYPFAQM